MTYNELIGFAVGVMKLSRDDVDWMTPAEFQCCSSAWNNQQEQNSKSAYELSRFNAWLCLTPNLKANTTVQDVCRFEWEELQLAKVHYGKTDTISKT